MRFYVISRCIDFYKGYFPDKEEEENIVEDPEEDEYDAKTKECYSIYAECQGT